MEKEFVPYEPTLALKDIGYQNPNPIGGYRGGAIFYYDKGSELFYDGLPMYSSSYHEGQIIAPLYQQVFRWFRENHKLVCLPEPTGSWRYSCHYRSEDKDGKHWVGYLRDKENKIIFYDSYEEAELACLKKLIEIAKETK
jgi:hypothetical protein